MAIGTKGMTLRLSNSSDLVTVQSSVIQVTTSGGNFKLFVSSDTAEVDFVSLGYSAGNRITITSLLNTAVYTIFDVISSRIRTKELETDGTADASTNLSITQYSMEDIGEIVSIDGPSGSVPVIDITNLGSTASEKLVGIQDEGQVSMEVLTNFTTGSTGVNQWKLREMRQTGTNGFFDLIFTDETRNATTEPSAYFFDGFIINFSPGAAIDDAVKTAISLEITGQAHFINAVSS